MPETQTDSDEIPPATDEKAAVKRPRSVTRLAIFFVIVGLLSAMETAFEFFIHPVPSINFLIAFVGFGIGLWRGYEPARVFTIFCAIFVAAFYAGAIVFHLSTRRDQTLLNDVIFWVISSGAILSSLWSVYLLNKRKVIRFFKVSEDDEI